MPLYIVQMALHKNKKVGYHFQFCQATTRVVLKCIHLYNLSFQNRHLSLIEYTMSTVLIDQYTHARQIIIICLTRLSMFIKSLTPYHTALGSLRRNSR
jgi:hypothetical protein